MNYNEMFRAAIKEHCVFYKNVTDSSTMLHIGYGIDDSYARCMAASIASVCENNRKQGITFHILAAKLQTQTKKKIEALAKCFSVEINLYEIDDTVFKSLPTQVHFPLSIYYRYVLPLVLDQVDKLLYLDADILNIRDLSDLLQLDMEEHIIAAVPDLNWMGRKRNKALGLTHHQYFNSGVLWIDIARWNEFDVLGKSVEVLQGNPKRFRYPDQDALNIVLSGKVQYLDRAYNCIDIDTVKQDEIVLLHFAAHPKPWNIAWPISRLCTAFTGELYCKYEQLTAWKDEELQMPRNYKEMKIYAKCLWYAKNYKKSIYWKLKYLMTKFGIIGGIK